MELPVILVLIVLASVTIGGLVAMIKAYFTKPKIGFEKQKEERKIYSKLSERKTVIV